MMWLKTVAVWVVLELGFDVVFQDLDVAYVIPPKSIPCIASVCVCVCA